MELFLTKAYEQIPRILGLGDSHSESETFGCFDRNYWHYRLIDFPNARFQEAILPLSWVYSNDFSGNRYFQNQNLKACIQGILLFWTQRCHADGSADEVYPYERSFCATSFTMMAVTESLLLLRQEPIPKLKHTANWLCRKENSEVSNQMAAAACALYFYYLLTDDHVYKKAAESKINRLLEKQDSLGYFPEYGGFDLGYLTITLSCLAKYYQKSQDPRVFQACEKAIRLMEKHIQADGNYDFSSMSRQTQFVYPHGFVIFKSCILDKVTRGLELDRVIHPGWLDDRYVIPLCADYLQAYGAWKCG